MTIKKICILGGSGFVGIHLVNKLVTAGHPVRVLTRVRAHAKAVAVLPGVEVVEANIFEQAELERHFADIDVVINLVGILHERKSGQSVKSPARPNDFQEVHVELPRKVVQACAASGVRRLLHMSALQADPAAPSAYLRSKGLGEAIVLEAGRKHGVTNKGESTGAGFVDGHGLAVTVFRPSVIFGQDDSFTNLFARLLKTAPVFPLACPDAKFQPVCVDDVAQAFVTSISSPATFGQRYDLCGPRVYSLRELVEQVGAMSGSKCRVVGLGLTLSYLLAWLMEWMPGKKVMTRDNYLSMQVDSVCGCEFPSVFGINPRPLEAVAPAYLVDSSTYHGHRSAAGR